MRAAALPPQLQAVAWLAAEAGLFFDFDGCLAPIVADPGQARAAPGAEEALARLAERFALVAVMSGRSVADLARRVRAPGVRLVGLHGMEERHGEATVIALSAAAASEAVRRAAARIEAALAGAPDIVIERKGAALAVHFRRAEDPDEAQLLAEPLVREAAREEGLAVVPGRRILEVRPAEGGDKGDALRRLAAEHGLRAVLAVGDDTGDLPAFVAAGELEIAARVAVASMEAPPELLRLADVVVETPERLVALLAALAEAADAA